VGWKLGWAHSTACNNGHISEVYLAIVSVTGGNTTRFSHIPNTTASNSNRLSVELGEIALKYSPML
jgi:hypothetical protein